MQHIWWFAALTLLLLATPMANAEIIKGVMGIRGAEMT
jgi:hypothetical protein